MKHIIAKFLDPTIPAWGASEEEIDKPWWPIAEEDCDPNLPGEGLARHDMLYIGEGCKRSERYAHPEPPLPHDCAGNVSYALPRARQGHGIR